MVRKDVETESTTMLEAPTVASASCHSQASDDPAVRLQPATSLLLYVAAYTVRSVFLSLNKNCYHITVHVVHAVQFYFLPLMLSASVC